MPENETTSILDFACLEEGDKAQSKDMSMKDWEKLLTSLCQARSKELTELQGKWTTPTPKQEKRLQQIRREYAFFSRRLRELQKFIKMTKKLHSQVQETNN